MKLLSPTPYKRLNEAAGFLLLAAGLVMLLSLISYHTQDPSLDTAAVVRPLNLVGYPGAYLSDIYFQLFGAAAFLLPLLTFLLAWRWIRSEDVEAGAIKLAGTVTLTLSACAALSFLPWRMFSGNIRIGGTIGYAIANYLVDTLNMAGAVLFTVTGVIISLYLVSKFTIAQLGEWLAGPIGWVERRRLAFYEWRERVQERALQKAQAKESERKTKADAAKTAELEAIALAKAEARAVKADTRRTRNKPLTPEAAVRIVDTPPWETAHEAPPVENAQPEELEYASIHEIPICPIEDMAPTPAPALVPDNRPAPAPVERKPMMFEMPSSDLLNEVPGRSAYDEQELKEIAVRIKSKFEEFNVLGNVTQINPGPVVTTFEFKPEAGIKYSKITNLTEDLCLGLQAESILIERIPGKPTVGIEVPNTKRELIALRQMLESDEFQQNPSHLTIALGKDINGRIRVAALDAMPHLLIAGSTGSGKSVMINSMIMSILYKATPDDVRFIMVDPKRVELGIYENIPHLLTPVIVDPKKATNALKNAVLEMERRLRLLAEVGVRNIEQYNKKVRKLQEQPRSLFTEGEEPQEDPKPLPYILILIDELADLMMLEGKNVEESVTRLAQMARAVGMHLVLATQRPSVDVITGLIKANFPARISFRVATRVDSRTILDVMGAEHLLGKGDMLFLPPGSSRLTRVHGAFVTENEIGRVVDFWKEQAKPEFDQSYLIAPPSDENGEASDEVGNDEQDALYEDAVKLVLQMGKASTSTLQRHLRLGYGRAARILDMMQRDGIIGPPDGSKPRDVLKRPDWLHQVEGQLR
ncbi:MAG TPA: DNA translocase FtsK [Bryobacteraceae bacterium]|nr:DNA translocase FtsK [Bryobacteraceae bacterium]